MATIEAFPNRLPARVEAQPRIPPANVEAEQALLGAILINNDAYDRVSDFLRAEHFVEEIHRRIYEIAGSLIRAGKIASPITLKTFLGEHDLGHGLTVQQYLARLALEATTIINAHDYGRAIHDLAMRRELIRIGEDIVNVAFDSPVDASPREQIEEAEKRLYQIADGGKYGGGFQSFSDALKTRGRHGRARLRARRPSERRRHRPLRSRPQDGRPASLRSHHHRRPPRHGQDRASPPTSPSTSPRRGAASRAPTARSRRWTAASSASSRWKCRPSNSPPASSPSNRACRPTRSGAATSPRTTSIASVRR